MLNNSKSPFPCHRKVRSVHWAGAPGSEGKTNLETVVRIADNGEHVLSNIHKPSLTPHLPTAMAGQASGGCAVIVAPGGHRELWSDHEGHNVARWLSDRGIAAFVLKYRLARETNSTYTSTLAAATALASAHTQLSTLNLQINPPPNGSNALRNGWRTEGF